VWQVQQQMLLVLQVTNLWPSGSCLEQQQGK
jgi:hypothetical protein